MNINIEKISNGFVLTIGSKKIFCDVPEAVCGNMAEWALEECKRLDAPHAQETASALLALKLYADMELEHKQASILPRGFGTSHVRLDP